MMSEVVLVVIFRRVERLERHNLRDDRMLVRLRLRELCDGGLRGALLIGVPSLTIS